MPYAALDPLGLLECLSRHRVDHVVIGMMAAALHGSPLPLLRTLLETIQRRAKGEPDRS